MTYYEELGVAPTAPREEIRQAYRRLVRLVHPDRCTEEETRRLADLQMKRLNAILDTLSDPAHRDTYDRSLQSPAPPVSPKLRPVHFAAAAIIAFAIFALWPARRPVPQPVVAAPAAPAKPARVLAPRPRPREPQVPAAIPEAPLFAQPEEALPALSFTAAPIPPIGLPVPSPPQETAPPSLAGQWLFVGRGPAKTTGYAPEYIELRLVESAGIVRGHYRARYRVADQAISPTVNFQFEGRAGPEGGVLMWHGAGGARGEVSLKLLPVGTLEVNWAAQQLGGDLGLISGTATLVRKLD